MNIRAAKKKEVQNIAKASVNKIGININIEKIALPSSITKTIDRNLQNQPKMQQAKALDIASCSASTDPRSQFAESAKNATSKGIGYSIIFRIHGSSSSCSTASLNISITHPPSAIQSLREITEALALLNGPSLKTQSQDNLNALLLPSALHKRSQEAPSIVCVSNGSKRTCTGTMITPRWITFQSQYVYIQRPCIRW